MKLERMIWQLLVLPTLTAGLLMSSGAYCCSGSVLMAAFVFGACLSTTLGIAWMLERQQKAASAQLRNPELRGLPHFGSGIYKVVLQDTFALLAKLEAEARLAVEAKTEADGRYRVRQKQIRRLEAAFHGLAEPVLVTDPRNKVLSWNPAAAEVLRPDRDKPGPADASVAPDLKLLPELNRLLSDTCTRSAATTSRSVELELRVAGAPRVFRATATNLLDDDGSVLGMSLILRDIGREKQEKSRHAEFVSSVCHELKTPMASIKAFIEMLTDGDVDDRDEQMRLYGFIDMQVDRLTRLVNNMLNLARIESGVISVRREDCGLNEILEKSLQVVEPMAKDKNIQLIPQPCELYLPVHVDRDLFGQAIINLLSNAIKYTPAGGEVRMRSRMNDDEAIIDVRDTGMGIPEADLSRLFQRFFRVAQNNKAAEGTGLGLALVQYIVSSVHNGRVTVESKVNEGSCFSVAIPLGHRDQSRRKVVEPHLCTA